MDDRTKSFLYIDENDGLVARFPRVQDIEKQILFQRTLRVPDDGKTYPLPAGLGVFPLRNLEDFKANLPSAWRDRNGVIMPMYRADAMWIAFVGSYPCAIKIGAGRTNALNGRRWSRRLSRAGQDYIVAPPQAALDGYCTGKDEVRQFVAVPLGRGEELMHEAEHGGIQIVAYPMKKERYEELRAKWVQESGSGGEDDAPDEDMRALASGPRPVAVGLAAGGRLSQRVGVDPFGIDAWDQSARVHCFVTLVDAQQWARITGGGRPPSEPLTPADYAQEGVPWFKYGDDDLRALEGAPELAAVKSAASIAAGGGLQALPAVGSVNPSDVRHLRLVRPPRRSQHPNPVVRTYWTIHNRLLRG